MRARTVLNEVSMGGDALGVIGVGAKRVRFLEDMRACAGMEVEVNDAGTRMWAKLEFSDVDDEGWAELYAFDADTESLDEPDDLNVEEMGLGLRHRPETGEVVADCSRYEEYRSPEEFEAVWGKPGAIVAYFEANGWNDEARR